MKNNEIRLEFIFYTQFNSNGRGFFIQKLKEMGYSYMQFSGGYLLVAIRRYGNYVDA